MPESYGQLDGALRSSIVCDDNGGGGGGGARRRIERKERNELSRERRVQEE